MNDNELLKFAAKAAGIENFQNTSQFRSDIPYFNPLIDDGDALRLAIKLGFEIDLNIGIKRQIFVRSHFYSDAKAIENIVGRVSDIGDDVYAATRRAIVRAAAEIGKTL